MKKLIVFLLLSTILTNANAQKFGYASRGVATTVVNEKGPVDFQWPFSVPSIDSLTVRMMDSMSDATHPNIIPFAYRLKSAPGKVYIWNPTTRKSSFISDSTYVSTVKAAIIHYTDSVITNTIANAVYGGSVDSTSDPDPTVNTYWTATQAAIAYDSMGGVRIYPNSIAFISYLASTHTYSVSQTSINLSDYTPQSEFIPVRDGLYSAFTIVDDVDNYTGTMNESSASIISQDQAINTFYGFGSPVGVRNNVQAVKIKIQARPTNVSPLTSIRLWITKKDKSGTILADKSVSGLNIAAGGISYVTFVLDSTLVNSANDSLFISYRANQQLYFFGIINDVSLYPYPTYGGYTTTTSAATSSPSTFSNGFMPAANQRVAWALFGDKTLAPLPNASLVQSLNNQVVPVEQPPNVAYATTQYLVSGGEFDIYYENLHKIYNEGIKGKTEISITPASGISNIKQTGIGTKFSVTTPQLVNGGVSVLNNSFAPWSGFSFKSIKIQVSDSAQSHAISVLNIGDSYTKLQSFANYQVEHCASGVTYRGTRQCNGLPSIFHALCEGRGGKTLAFYMTQNTTLWTPFMHPVDPYKYWGNTSFWLSAKNAPTYDTEDFPTSIKNLFSGSTGLLVSPATNDVMYDNSASAYKVFNGSSWVTISESTLSFTFNFAKYRSTWGISSIDAIHILLGTNDFANKSEIEVAAMWDSWKASLDIMIASIKADLPNAHIAIGIPVPAGKQGVNGTMTTERNNRAYWYHKNRVITTYQGLETSSKIYLLDYHTQINRTWDYPSISELPNKFYTGGLSTDIYLTDWVHLSTTGFGHMGVVYSGWIQYIRGVLP